MPPPPTEANLNVPDIRSTIKLPSIIRDGLRRFCGSKNYRILWEISDIGEFCEGIHITGCTFQVIGRAPIRRNSGNARNDNRQAAPIRERNTTKDLSRTTEQGVSTAIQPANVPVKIGGALDVRYEVRDKRTFERNRDYMLPAGVTHTQDEEHYMAIFKYHVTLVAQADRMIRVLSKRILSAGGIGAAGGGLGGAAAGAGAGAAAGTCSTT